MSRFASLTLLATLAGCTWVSDSLLRDPVSDCTGEADGTPCKGADFCVQGACIFTACGDGYVDLDAGEVCDDANLVSGDGCEPGICQYSCEHAVDCEDPNPCRATMGCDVTTHRCKGLVATSGAACERTDGTTGVCTEGLCPAAGCGDGTLVAPEECDDDTPGCAADCTFVCETDEECFTENVCSDARMCDVASHTCVEAPDLVCDDGDACTASTCDPVLACSDVIIDGDGDTFSPGECAEGSAAVGGDCDDGDADVRPGAPEAVDGVDQDCDMRIDEDPGVNCLRDADGDGYGDPDMMMFAKSCPEGYVAPRTRNDCHDGNPNVSPGQTTASSFPYCPPGSTLMGSAGNFSCSGPGSPTWDWNCDGEQAPTNTSMPMCGTNACSGSGWNNQVPPCGGSGTAVTCVRECVIGGGVLCNCKRVMTPNVQQYCL